MAHVEAQGGLGRKNGKLSVGIWLGLSTGWATVAINRPPAALGAPHAPWNGYPFQRRKGLKKKRTARKTPVSARDRDFNSETAEHFNKTVKLLI